MATKSIAWTTGTGNITLSYTGQGNDTVVVTSDENDLYVDRSQTITFATTAGSPTVTQQVTVTQKGKPEVVDYLKFTALESGTFTLTIGSNVRTSDLSYIEYSTNEGETWTKTDNVASTTVTITTPTIAAGNSVLWRGSGVRMPYGGNYTSAPYWSVFSSTGQFNISGNINTLLGLNKPNNVTASTYMYSHLFYNIGNKIVDVSRLVLPCESLNNYCYYYMFYGCTSLTSAPTLPATSLKTYCYSYMFYGCTSLTTAPALPATALATYCYSYMFYGCTSLTTAPALPVTALANSCYRDMFYGCTSLTTAPALPAGTLTSNCYTNLFRSCSILNYIKALFTTTPSSSYTNNWVNGVASTGIFVKNINAAWTTTGTIGVPTNWTVIYYDTSDSKYYIDKNKSQECDDHGNPI